MATWNKLIDGVKETPAYLVAGVGGTGTAVAERAQEKVDGILQDTRDRVQEAVYSAKDAAKKIGGEMTGLGVFTSERAQAHETQAERDREREEELAKIRDIQRRMRIKREALGMDDDTTPPRHDQLPPPPDRGDGGPER